MTCNCLRPVLNQAGTALTDVHRNSHAQLANTNATWPKRLDNIHGHTLQQDKFGPFFFSCYFSVSLRHRTVAIPETGSKGDQRHTTTITRALLHKGGEGWKDRRKENNQLRDSAIVEIYTIMRGIGSMPTSNKEPKEQQSKAKDFKVIKEGNCSFNIVKLQNSLVARCSSCKKFTRVKARLDSLMKVKLISSLLKETHRNTFLNFLRDKLLDVRRVIHTSTSLYLSHVFTLP